MGGSGRHSWGCWDHDGGSGGRCVAHSGWHLGGADEEVREGYMEILKELPDASVERAQLIVWSAHRVQHIINRGTRTRRFQDFLRRNPEVPVVFLVFSAMAASVLLAGWYSGIPLRKSSAPIAIAAGAFMFLAVVLVVLSYREVEPQVDALAMVADLERVRAASNGGVTSSDPAPAVPDSAATTSDAQTAGQPPSSKRERWWARWRRLREAW